MKKKWIAVLLTLAMTGSMAACGSGSGAKSDSGDKDEAKDRQWNCGPVGQMGQIQPKQRRANKKFEEQTGIKVNKQILLMICFMKKF